MEVFFLSAGMEKRIKYGQDQFSKKLVFKHKLSHNAVVLRVMLKSIILLKCFEHNVSKPKGYPKIIGSNALRLTRLATTFKSRFSTLNSPFSLKNDHHQFSPYDVDT